MRVKTKSPAALPAMHARNSVATSAVILTMRPSPFLVSPAFRRMVRSNRSSLSAQLFGLTEKSDVPHGKLVHRVLV